MKCLMKLLVVFFIINNVHAQTTICEVEHKSYRCSIGKSGIINARNKMEGDGATPEGTFQIRPLIFYNANKLSFDEIKQIRIMKTKAFKIIALTDHDIWIDDKKSRHYNQWIKINTNKAKKIISFEKLKREQDDIYNIVIPIGYNDNPVIPGKGSAIFLHIARDEYKPTAGCIAFKKEDLLEILQKLTPHSKIIISKEKITLV